MSTCFHANWKWSFTSYYEDNLSPPMLTNKTKLELIIIKLELYQKTNNHCQTEQHYQSVVQSWHLYDVFMVRNLDVVNLCVNNRDGVNLEEIMHSSEILSPVQSQRCGFMRIWAKKLQI